MFFLTKLVPVLVRARSRSRSCVRVLILLLLLVRVPVLVLFLFLALLLVSVPVLVPVFILILVNVTILFFYSLYYPYSSYLFLTKHSRQILGWGRNNGANNALPTYLQQSQVPVVAHSTCTRTNGNFVHESSMVCAGARGSSACNGDSGGPLVCQEGGRWVLRGAASWVTSKQCLTSKYSVYARISSFINWINSKTAGGGGGGGGGT